MLNLALLDRPSVAAMRRHAARLREGDLTPAERLKVTRDFERLQEPLLIGWRLLPRFIAAGYALSQLATEEGSEQWVGISVASGLELMQAITCGLTYRDWHGEYRRLNFGVSTGANLESGTLTVSGTF